MNALIIYDSVFGNTEKIAQAMGAALNAPVVKVDAVTQAQLAGLDVLIVGSPTRSFRSTPAIADFIKAIPAGALQGVRVSGFDTRIALETIKSGFFRGIVKMGGYAAKPIADALVKKGATLAQTPEGFIVQAEQGPLRAGELERAAAWARQLAA